MLLILHLLMLSSPDILVLQSIALYPKSDSAFLRSHHSHLDISIWYIRELSSEGGGEGSLGVYGNRIYVSLSHTHTHIHTLSLSLVID